MSKPVSFRRTSCHEALGSAKEVLENPADISSLLSKISDARANKLLLFEKRIEEQIRGILERKGW